MGFIAEIHVSHDALLLQPTIAEINSLSLRREYEMSIPPGEPRLYISAIGDVPPAFDAQLSEDPTIAEPRPVVAFADRTIYRLRVATDLVPVPTVFSEVDGYVLDAESDTDGWLIRSHLPDRDAIIRIREYFRDRDVTFQVVRLFDSEGIDKPTHAGLTERQRDLLLTALYSGYYDIPRRASQGDLAEQLDVSTSAVSKRLRRAVSQLIVSSLSPEDIGHRKSR